MQVDLSGLRAVVTAGAAGIGRAIAGTFLECGARVHVCDVAADALADFKTAHPAAGASLADVADVDAVERLFREAARALGGLDVLVNNAGVAGPTAAVEDIEPEDWDRTIAVNISGMFYCARLAVPLLKAAGGGAIVNMSSVAGRLGFPMRSPYAASKWAVVGFTQTLAMELGPFNVRVNAILPGIVAGERIERVIAARAAALGIAKEEQRRRRLSQVSLRRMVDAADVAHMAAFLCSPLGRNVTGQALSVCGNVETMA
jgi:NAD(P)-dependent dehydrogenase (short-subunit alcohol dehydrogenase family)